MRSVRFESMKLLIALLVLVAQFASAEDVISPDSKVTVRWVDNGEELRTISIIDSGNPVWKTTTTPRWTGASWSIDSRACLLWNAPDNANTDLLMVTRRGSRMGVTPLHFSEVCGCIEQAFPELRRDESEGLSRGGIESVEWLSANRLRFHVSYNNTAVVVTAKFENGRLGNLMAARSEQSHGADAGPANH